MLTTAVFHTSSVSFTGRILELLLDVGQSLGLFAAFALPLQNVFPELGWVHPTTTWACDPEAALLKSLQNLQAHKEKRQNHRCDTNTPNERKVSAEASSTCTEFRRQQLLSGKRLMCVELREAERTSLTSGKTSSITAWCALTLTLSPSSGATWTTTHSGHDCPRSRSVLQCSSWDCRGVSWKKQASSYSKENSCRGTRTNTTFTAVRWEDLYHSLVLMAHPHAFTPPCSHPQCWGNPDRNTSATQSVMGARKRRDYMLRL